MDLSKEIKALKTQLSDHSKISDTFKKESGYRKENIQLENKINYLEKLQKDYSNAGYFKRKFLEFEHKNLTLCTTIFYALSIALIYLLLSIISQLN